MGRSSSSRSSSSSSSSSSRSKSRRKSTLNILSTDYFVAYKVKCDEVKLMPGDKVKLAC